MDKASVCTLDCPDTCSLTVTVEQGRIVRVRGSRANPFTHGAICRKVARYTGEFVHGARRLRTPLRRVGERGGDAFEPIGWEQALDLVHAGLQRAIERFGPQSVMPFNYAGPHGLLARDSMSLRFFHRLGATRLDRPPLCGGIIGTAYGATYGDTPSLPPEQLADAGLIVVWGNNVTVSNLHLARYIAAARRNGARLVVIDPRRLQIARKADLHLALRPGPDVVLAMALARELRVRGALDEAFIDRHVLGAEAYLEAVQTCTLEHAAAECGVAATAIARLAEWYAATPAAAIALGNGVERNRNGGAAVRAIGALPALTGKLGARSTGLMMGASRSSPLRKDRLQRPDLAPPATRCFNIVDVGRHLLDPDLDPPIAALMIYNHNPLIVHPDQNSMRRALSREDLFIVGADIAFTDSLRYADVVLPMSSSFEHADLFPAYGHDFLQRAEAVIDPVGESLPPSELFRRLAARFGFDDDPAFRDDDDALLDCVLDEAHPGLKGLRGSTLPLARAHAVHTPDASGHFAVQGTPSGCIELRSEGLAREFGCSLPAYRPLAGDYPLALISPASEQRITSTFGGVAACDATPPLVMHPTDALARGLAHGQRVRVWNDLGEVHLPLAVSDEVREGVVSSDKGAWLRTSDNGQTISALAPATRADLGGACYNDARVEVAALAP